MTPFGIRRRIKALLGFGSSAPAQEKKKRPEVPKIGITLVDPDGNEETVQASQGSTVLFATANMHKPLGSGCADATCGTCRVEVLEGEENLFPQSDRERATLKENGFPETLRLGCQAEIQKGAVKVKGYEFLI